MWVGIDFGGSFTPLFWFPDNGAKNKKSVLFCIYSKGKYSADWHVRAKSDILFLKKSKLKEK